MPPRSHPPARSRLLCGGGFGRSVSLGRLLGTHVGRDGPAKIEMDGGTDPFGAFDAGEAAEPSGQFVGGSDGRSDGYRWVKDLVETFSG